MNMHSVCKNVLKIIKENIAKFERYKFKLEVYKWKLAHQNIFSNDY